MEEHHYLECNQFKQERGCIIIRIRLSLNPQVQQRETTIPLEFRKYFISLTKKLLEGSPFSQRFEKLAPGYSPYVFNIHFCKIQRILPEQNTLIVRPPVFATFSTGLYNLMTHICNRAILEQDNNTVLGLNLNQIELLPNKTIHAGVVKFQVMGHAVLRGRDGYIDNTDALKIEEAINTHLQTKLKFFNQNITPLNGAVYSPVKLIEYHELTKGVCRHYGGKVTSLRGKFMLAGSPSSLQFLYDYGLGTRTGQGFGLLEVVKQL